MCCMICQRGYWALVRLDNVVGIAELLLMTMTILDTCSEVQLLEAIDCSYLQHILLRALLPEDTRSRPHGEPLTTRRRTA